jgi:ribonuclease HI
MHFIIHSDGGARGNPGPAAIGAVVDVQNTSGTRSTVATVSKRIGDATNNVAEYAAVFEALTHLRDYCRVHHIHTPTIEFRIDSRLVVNQLNGIFKVKDGRLREIIARIHIIEQELGGNIGYVLVPRSQNARADMLVNRALDSIL